MIAIRCTELEQVRKNPVAYAQALASDNNSNGGGTHGMFACFKDVARTVHLKDRTFNEGIKDLQGKFIRFVDNPQNNAKQEKLIEQFSTYFKMVSEMGFEMIDGSRQMKWNIISNGRLSGLTPWVVENEQGLYSYVLAQQAFDWQTELRFPLYQKYICDNTMKCNLNEMKIGIYNLSTGNFEFTSFSNKIMRNTLEETTAIFESVNKELSEIRR